VHHETDSKRGVFRIVPTNPHAGSSVCCARVCGLDPLYIWHRAEITGDNTWDRLSKEVLGREASDLITAKAP
jgi:hypothetical protein